MTKQIRYVYRGGASRNKSQDGGRSWYRVATAYRFKDEPRRRYYHLGFRPAFRLKKLKR